MLRAGGAGRSPAGSPPPPPPPLAISHFLLPSRPEGGKKKKKKGLRGCGAAPTLRSTGGSQPSSPPAAPGCGAWGRGGGERRAVAPQQSTWAKRPGPPGSGQPPHPAPRCLLGVPPGGFPHGPPLLGPHHRPTCSGPGAAAGRAPRPSAGSARPAPPPRTAGSRRQEAAPRHPALLHFSPSTVPKGPRGSPGLPTPPPGLPTLPPPFLGAPRSLLIKPRVPTAFLLHSLLGCFGAFGPKILSPCEAPGSRCQPESLVGCWVVV